MFWGDPFQILFAKFRCVNKHGISVCWLLAQYKHIEILVNSSLKATKKKKIAYSHLKNSGELSRAILALLFHNLKAEYCLLTQRFRYTQ